MYLITKGHMMRVFVKVEYAHARCPWNCSVILYGIGPRSHMMNYVSACYNIGQCYVDLVLIGKCRHMVQVLSHSKGWLSSPEVSVGLEE